MAGRNTNNTFDDLNNNLFEQLERLADATPEELEIEVQRARAVTCVADKILKLGEIAIESEKMKHEYGGDHNYRLLESKI